jgi:hypothetical protein
MFLQVVGEIRSEMLDVELRLLDRVETDDELVEPRRPHHQHDLLVADVGHG